jgi:hypothetical protein
MTHAASEGLMHLLLDGQDVLTKGITIRPIKDENTNPMVIPEEIDLTRRQERNAVILQKNVLYLIMSRSLMFGLHHLLETDEKVLAENHAKAAYSNICSHFKSSSVWFEESIQYKWDSIVMTTPTESFNMMQAVLAKCSSAEIAITQQNAAIRFSRLLQPLSPSYIPLMQFGLTKDNITLYLL